MKDQLAAVLAQDGETLDDAIQNARSEVIFQKIQNLQFAATVVTPKEVDAELARKYDRAKIKYIAFTPAKFRDQVKITPEEIKAYYDAHKNQYINPEKRSFQVLVIDQDKVQQGIAITDAQLRGAYSASMDNFRTPERVHVRHILFKTTDKSDAEKKALLAKAQDVLKQIKSGADFALLAKQYSDDTGNAQKGGDLDWVVKGQTVPEFEKVAFSLKPGETSDVITTPYGYHIVQVLAHEQPRVKPFEEVKAQLTDDLRKQQVSDKMQEIADKAHEELAKNPGSADQIAKQLGIEVVTVTKAASGDAIPTLGVSPEIDTALNQMSKPNEVSQLLTLPANRLAIAVLKEKFPPAPETLQEAEGKIKDRLTDDKAQQLSQDKAKEAAQKIEGGEDFDKVAKSMKLEAKDSNLFGHADSIEGVGPATYLEDAFTKAIGSVVGPVNVLNTQVVYRILEQQKVDVTKVAGERQAIAANLKTRRRDQAHAGVFPPVVRPRSITHAIPARGLA
jgi:peptidyl-prolyl cis-trans isomerase D